MDSEELRPIVLHVLKTYPDNRSLSVAGVIDAVQRFGVNKGIYPQHTGQFRGGISPSCEILMPLEDREKARQILWQLIIEGVLVPGHDELNLNLPHLRITEYGKKCLQEDAVIPHDPDGYLKYLKGQVPSLDPIAEMYVSEALQAYLRGLMLSSTVMLGAASEKSFLLLFDVYVAAIQDTSRNSKLQQIQNSFIKTKFEGFQMDFEYTKKSLPKELRENIDLQLTAIFNLIRITRNEIGHPTGTRIDRGLAYSNLRIFVPYVKRIYDLVDYFSENSV